MRGRRVGADSRRLDLVLTSVRLRPEGGRLMLARGYERHGVVWSDLKLFGRDELLERLRRGARVAVGETAKLPGDFATRGRVRVHGQGPAARLGLNGAGDGAEDLDLPLF